MNAKKLLEGLIVAARAETPEQVARVAWRFSDWMWDNVPEQITILEARLFNNLIQDMELPWCKDLWTKEEIEKRRKKWDVGSALQPVS